MKNLLYILLLSQPFFLFSQEEKKKGEFIYEVIDGDTIPILVQLEEVEVRDADYWTQWRRTVFFTQRMYPYAEIIDSITNEIDSVSDSFTKKRQKKKYLKKKGKELREDFDLEIRQMSVTRGKFLELLVHRKSNTTIYSLIKKYKNGRQAFLWNMLLKIYGGANLKEEYQPDGKHQMLAEVIEKIEKGEIKTFSRAYQKQKLLNEQNNKKKK